MNKSSSIVFFHSDILVDKIHYFVVALLITEYSPLSPLDIFTNTSSVNFCSSPMSSLAGTEYMLPPPSVESLYNYIMHFYSFLLHHLLIFFCFSISSAYIFSTICCCSSVFKSNFLANRQPLFINSS